MSTSSDLKSGDFFFRTSTPHPSPDRVCQYHSPPLSPPPQAISWEKCGSIYQGLQMIEYSSNQILAYIGVTKKKLCSFCLQRTTCITHENKARNSNTSIWSQMISEFWNIWSINLSFFWATDPNFLLYGGFWYARAGDYLCIRETSG